MNERPPPLVAETEALKETYAALNRNDIEAAVRPFDPQMIWIEPSDYPLGGAYHGRAAVQAWSMRPNGAKGATRLSTRSATARPSRCAYSTTSGRLSNGLGRRLEPAGA
jgi:hypothetical protein